MTPPDPHFVAGFLGGLALGLLLGATFGLFIAACCVAGARDDRALSNLVSGERSTARASEWDGVVLAALDDNAARAPPDPAVLPFRRPLTLEKRAHELD